MRGDHCCWPWRDGTILRAGCNRHFGQPITSPGFATKVARTAKAAS